jgi:uncharacterized glyoxalase superfamily protein PhnB
MAVKPIPEGFHSITPYLIVRGVPQLLDFLKKAFGAQEDHRTALPDGTIMHAQVRIGDSPVMMGEAHSGFQVMPCSLYLYVEDTDAVYRRALDAGGTSIMEPANQFYGDRNAGVRDPAGNSWWIATHLEDVAPEEIAKRAASHAKPRPKPE